MAQVENTKPFEVIYSFEYYPILGYLLEAYAVPLLSSGKLSLAHQQIHELTADYFGIFEEEMEAIICLDKTDPKKLFKKFYNQKKAIKSKEWLHEVLDEKTFKNHVRPYIDKQIHKALSHIGNRRVFLNKDNNPIHKPLKVVRDTSILFHLRRDERGTIYFPTFKANGEVIQREPRSNALLTVSPPVFLIESTLLIFNAKIDGQKLIPFVNKKFIAIEKTAEEAFFKKFMVPLIEEYDVYSKGVEIISEKHIAKAILEVSMNLQNEKCFVLKFDYNGKIYSFHTTKKVSVHLEKKDDNTYLFHRIKRSKTWEGHKMDSLKELGLTNQEGSLLYPEKEIHPITWLIENKARLEELGFDIKMDTEKPYSLIKPEFEVKINEKTDWFDVQIVVQFGEFSIPFSKLKKAIMQGLREITLPNGEIGLLPMEWVSRIQELQEHNIKNTGDNIHIRHFHQGSISLLQGIEENAKSKYLELLKLEKVKEYPVPTPFQGTLREYQKTGFNWLNTLHEIGLGGILADDMGLGKTIQALAFLSYIKETKGQCSLLILPTSLIYNWLSELKKFAPHLKVHLHFGYTRKKELAEIHKNVDVILSTYGIVRNDIELFQKLEFQTILIDEGQNIKNHQSITAKAVKKLNAQSRFSLTGTPIENSLSDLWSQMDFVNSGLLFSQAKFKKQFLNPIEKLYDENASIRLKELIQPFILGRKKAQVAPELPSKTEQVLLCGMSEEQNSLYERIKSEYRNELLLKIEEDGMQKSKLHILTGLMKLRQIANHPLLVQEEMESGKFELLKEKLHAALSGGHKVLIFSQFVEFLKIIKEYLQKESLPFSYIDGKTTAKNRNEEVDNFKSNPEINIFLISLKAGGTGLNLQEADYVFMMDPWWNPAAEKQAEDRAHRIGQEQKVHVYKFITKDTLEEKILKLQQNKSNLSKKIISYEESFVKKFDKALIENLLI